MHTEMETGSLRRTREPAERDHAVSKVTINMFWVDVWLLGKLLGGLKCRRNNSVEYDHREDRGWTGQAKPPARPRA